MIKRVKQQKQEDVRGLLEEMSRKVASGEVGSTAVEKLGYVTQTFSTAGNTVEYGLMKFVTADPKMLQEKNKIRILGTREDIEDPILITGPTGTGKELLARALDKGMFEQQYSNSKKQFPFVAENCAAIPEQLAESIFFGHVKGAFTGANETRIGLLEEAGSGIIFLDEIGDMSLPLQAKFLRAIQEGTIRKVGSTEVIKLRCRFIAATKYDLEQKVDAGLFREDLFARLMTFEIKVTGLVDRKDDIPLIFKALHPNKLMVDKLPPLPETTIQRIYKYNVRAIETAIARWMAFESYE